jgi:outer membrane immunogenic protein
MKNLVISGVTLIGLSAAASAADLPSRMAIAPAAVPVFTWTGFYGGLNAGAGFDTNSDRTVFVPPDAFPPPPPPPPPTAPPEPTVPPAGDPFLDFKRNDKVGFVFGGQIGYNWQYDAFVFGVEADIQAADIGGSTVTTVRPEVLGFTPRRRSNDVDWFGTVRGRAGVAFDRILIYATGGFAYGGTDNGDDFFDNDDDVRTGWAAGGGVEWALPTTAGLFGSSAITLGVEGLFVSLEHNKSNFIGTFVDQPVFFPGTDKDDNEFAVVRAKLNLKF